VSSFDLVEELIAEIRRFLEIGVRKRLINFLPSKYLQPRFPCLPVFATAWNVRDASPDIWSVRAPTAMGLTWFLRRRSRLRNLRCTVLASSRPQSLDGNTARWRGARSQNQSTAEVTAQRTKSQCCQISRQTQWPLTSQNISAATD